MNYAYNSPFKDLAPARCPTFWRHPGYFFVAQWKDVILMHERDKSARKPSSTARATSTTSPSASYYMKMHGIETKDPVTMVFGKGDQRSEAEIEAAALGLEAPGW